MDNLIILSGLLTVIRAYWVFNLLNIERGQEKRSFSNFINDRNVFSYYIIIRPFYITMKDNLLKRKINIITYLIYICLIVGLYYVTKL